MSRPRRSRQILLDAAGRLLVFVLGSFVLWGTLMAVAYAHSVLTAGLDLRRLLPPADAEGALWAWLNLSSAVLALGAWTLGGLALWQGRRRG